MNLKENGTEVRAAIGLSSLLIIDSKEYKNYSPVHSNRQATPETQT